MRRRMSIAHHHSGAELRLTGDLDEQLAGRPVWLSAVRCGRSGPADPAPDTTSEMPAMTKTIGRPRSDGGPTVPEPVATPLSPRFYPIALRPADDPRFTFRLVSDVARVLAEHGYPEVRALDHGGLNQTLHGFLYTDAVAADEELVEALRTYRDESQRLVLLDPDDADDVTRLWLAIESESGADRPIDAEIVRAALQGLRRAPRSPASGAPHRNATRDGRSDGARARAAREGR